MVEHLYMAFGFHIQGLFHCAAVYKYRHIAIKYIDFLLCIINHCSCCPDAAKRNDHASNEKQGTEDKHKLDFVL